MGVRSWLRGIKDSIKWVAESVWRWVRHPPAALVLLLCLAACKPDPSPTPFPTPSPTPTVTPTPSPTPTPTPTPSGCFPPDTQTGWTEWQTLPPEHIEAVRAAEVVIGSVCGFEPEDSLDKLGSQLRLQGLCAGRLDDAVFVRRSDNVKLWSEYHAVAYLTGCWTIKERMYRGVWHHE